MNRLDIRQGSKEWFAARVGCVTGSRVGHAIGRLTRKSGDKKAGDPTGAQEKYALEMAAEILTGKALDHYVSEWMELGKENEPLARTAYEMLTGADVELIGIVFHPNIKRAAASPDGLVAPDGLVEFKVPKITTHMDYWNRGRVPPEYEPQMMWQMACAGPEILWNDFVSHCPSLPAPYDTFIKRLPRDEKRIAEMEADVLQFLKDVDEMMDRWKERATGEPITERKLRESIALVRNGRPQPVVAVMEEERPDFFDVP